MVKPRDVESFLSSLNEIRTAKKRAANLLFEAIESDIIDQERFVLEQTEKIKEIDDNFNTMCEYEQVLRHVQIIMEKIQGGGNVTASMHGGIEAAEQFRGSLNAEEEKLLTQPNALPGGGDFNVAITQIAGTIDTDEKVRLKKLLFRSTRGKALTYFYDMPIDNSKPLDVGK